MVRVIFKATAVRIIKNLHIYEELHNFDYQFFSWRSYIKVFFPFDSIRQRYRYSSVLLYVDIQLFLRHWWRGPFSHYNLVSFCNIMSVCMWECFSWSLVPIHGSMCLLLCFLFVYMCTCVSVCVWNFSFHRIEV